MSKKPDKRQKSRLSNQASAGESPKGIDPKTREAQLVNQAMNLAENQIRNGTATSQVITHFLKIGSEREKLERERLKNENELLKAKVQQIADQASMMEVYKDAIRAMHQYSGSDTDFNEADLEFSDDFD